MLILCTCTTNELIMQRMVKCGIASSPFCVLYKIADREVSGTAVHKRTTETRGPGSTTQPEVLVGPVDPVPLCRCFGALQAPPK